MSSVITHIMDTATRPRATRLHTVQQMLRRDRQCHQLQGLNVEIPEESLLSQDLEGLHGADKESLLTTGASSYLENTGADKGATRDPITQQHSTENTRKYKEALEEGTTGQPFKQSDTREVITGQPGDLRDTPEIPGDLRDTPEIPGDLRDTPEILGDLRDTPEMQKLLPGYQHPMKAAGYNMRQAGGSGICEGDKDRVMEKTSSRERRKRVCDQGDQGGHVGTEEPRNKSTRPDTMSHMATTNPNNLQAAQNQHNHYHSNDTSSSVSIDNEHGSGDRDIANKTAHLSAGYNDKTQNINSPDIDGSSVHGAENSVAVNSCDGISERNTEGICASDSPPATSADNARASKSLSSEGGSREPHSSEGSSREPHASEGNTREQIYRRFQSWALRNYGDAGKTKTVTVRKYKRIAGILTGQEVANSDNSKFRFWVKAKGFRLGPPPPGEGGPDTQVLYVPTKLSVSTQLASAKINLYNAVIYCINHGDQMCFFNLKSS